MNDNLNKKNIVIVEDDVDTRQALKFMLESLGHNSVEFSGGEALFASGLDLKADIILLDIMMPKMNGYEVLNKLKELDNFKNLPVIMITAKDEDQEVLEGYKFGADYYITKPFTKRQLEYGLKMFLE